VIPPARGWSWLQDWPARFERAAYTGLSNPRPVEPFDPTVVFQAYDQEAHRQPVPVARAMRVLACLFHQVPVQMLQSPLVRTDVPVSPDGCGDMSGTNQVMSDGAAP
jgi:hypothetical protein